MSTPLHERHFESDETLKLPRPFIVRRLHSFLGVWLVIYLFEHLLINSQAALFFFNEGTGFVRMVNKIHNLPYLPAIEILFLGLPFLIHGIWGVAYALTGKFNSFKTSGKTPSLPQYRRNKAYTWQRITSWILLVGILAHVIHMRFAQAPIHVRYGENEYYLTKVGLDRGMPLIAEKLGVDLYNEQLLEESEKRLEIEQQQLASIKREGEWMELAFDEEVIRLESRIGEKERILEEVKHLLDSRGGLKEGSVLAISPSAGSAFLLVVREAFKNPFLVILYSFLVIAACFHGFNGLWTFMITWGATLTRRSQKRMRTLATLLMGVVTFFGLFSAWGTYVSTIWPG